MSSCTNDSLHLKKKIFLNPWLYTTVCIVELRTGIRSYPSGSQKWSKPQHPLEQNRRDVCTKAADLATQGPMSHNF